eukprot:GHRR01007456.1.p1 GENE.GHRR01007456.1~~GHRR01007456.1.p1  ORF type:complete len:342 (+),score=91.99 GHRR01007456.1:269-1294(+)
MTAQQGTTRMYGEGFRGAFARFQHSQEFADVIVTTASGDWRLHSLLLALKSEFFYRALAGEFTESRTKTVELHLENAEEVWPIMVDYFYRDEIMVSEATVLPLLALSRQLLVSAVDRYCLDFVSQHLSTSNCISYLRQAVKCNIQDTQQQCITLAARGFYFLYDADTSGLPATSVLEILRHLDLLVHCEQQVLRFVLCYLATTKVEEQDVADICSEVRFQYLDNKLLGSLASHPQLPQHLLLSGAMARLRAMDSPGLQAHDLDPPPRATYCCDLRYGLPGGTKTLTLELGDIWAHASIHSAITDPMTDSLKACICLSFAACSPACIQSTACRHLRPCEYRA